MLDTEKSFEEVRVEWNVSKTGVVVMLKDEAKDRALWKLVYVMENVSGKDRKVRGLKLKQENECAVHEERPLQLECHLEIEGEKRDWKSNPEA